VLSVPLAAVTTREDNPGHNNENNNDESSEGSPVNDETKKEENAPKTQEVVFVVQADGAAKKVAVKTGVSDFDNIQILKGVQEGDVVVSGPFVVVSKQLKDGDMVQEKKEAEK